MFALASLPASSPPSLARLLPLLDPLGRPVRVVIVAAVVLLTLAFELTPFVYDGGSLTAPILRLVVLFGCALGLRRFGRPRIAACIEINVMLMAISAAAAMGSLMLGATSLPWADEGLARADALLFLGFDWRAAFEFWKGYDTLLVVASHAYTTLNWQPILLITLLCLTGRTRDGWVFATAWTTSLAIMVMIFPFVPALGGYLYYGIAPADIRGVEVPAAWRFVESLQQVRSGELRLISPEVLTGVITFPSFHAAAAVLLAWSFRSLGRLRWPMLALNAVMFGSSVVIGGHYLVDVVAGGLVALASIRIAGALVGQEAASMVRSRARPENR